MADQPNGQHAQQSLQHQLEGLLGNERVLAGDADREFFSTDIFGGDRTAAMVIRPRNSHQLSEAVRISTDLGYAVIGRGGGTSYTGGYVPVRERSVIVDTSDLNRIIEINRDDMYVTVEAGVTWEALHDALKDTDLRTPFWGPLSGAVATVGGALSQNSILWGSTAHDVSAASVLSLEVVTARGEVLNTGSAATGARPFYRNYGPDMTGLFLGDCGALGIKTRATLRLIRRPCAVRLASFNFDDRAKFSRALVAIAREGLASTCFGMDPMLQYQRIKRASMGQGVKALKGVMSSGRSTFSGIRKAMQIAVAGKRFLDDNGYSLHLVVEASDPVIADSKMGRAKSICQQEGTEVEDSVPAMMYANPYVEMTSSIGPEGERWAPMHGLFPLSEGEAAWSRIEELMDEFSEDFDRLGIIAGYLLAAVSSTVFVIEPVLYWPAPRTAWHERMLSRSQLQRFRDFEDDPQVTATVNEARRRLNELFVELGASHLQIGKKYAYRQNLEPGVGALLESVKNALDPDGLMNPGSLGLGVPTSTDSGGASGHE